MDAGSERQGGEKNGSAFGDYSRYYDLLYRDKDYAGEARFVDGLLGATTAARSLLDVGCGTGAHAREFALLGWRVSGVDVSAGMIAIAQQRTPPEASVEYVNARAADFLIDGCFSAAVSLFHVVSYQCEEDEAFRMFRNVRRHLEPGAKFLFDFWHGAGVALEPPRVRVRRIEDERLRVTRIAEPDCRPHECRIDVAYECIVEDRASGRVERLHELHRLRYFFLPELQFMLNRAGFSILETRAGLSELPLTAQSWYGLIVAVAV